MRSPTRSLSQSEGWVLIAETEFGTEFETGVHTKARSPQLNGDNMSSSQVANATSNVTPLPLSEDNTNRKTTTPHKAPSNGSSTETADTTGTLTQINTGNATLARDVQTGVLFTYPSPESTNTPPLTHTNMALHQHALNQRYPGTIAGWVAGAGMGDRLLARSMLAASAAAAANSSSMASVAASGSVVGQDWLVVPPSAVGINGDDEVAAAGAWCERDIGPFGPYGRW